MWVVAGLAVATRLPSLLSSRHLGFDDGVYGASALAMRDGEVPFRQVFSSQGPLFLPMVWLADLAGFRRAGAPRLLGLVAIVVLTLATAAIGTRLRGFRCGLVAAVMVATSGSVLWVTGPLTSDGIATALAAAAVAGALAYDDAPSAGRAFVTALALAAALAVKSLLLPAVIPVAIVLIRRRRVAHLALAVGTGLGLALLTSLPFGIADVWDQSVTYHLDVADSRTPGANLRKVSSTLGDRDAPILVGATIALGAAAVSTVRARRRGRTASDKTLPPRARFDLTGERLIWVWWVAVFGILILEHPLWRNHLSHLAVPSSILVACGLDRAVEGCRAAWKGWRTGLGAAVAASIALSAVAAGYHLSHTWEVLNPGPNSRAAAEVVQTIADLPSGAWAISDEPGLVVAAGRRTPADLVDTSILRIESGRLTAKGVAREASSARVCAVVIWSHRFADIELGSLLGRSGYELARRLDGERGIWIKPHCRPR